jgi:hypothetical protein
LDGEHDKKQDKKEQDTLEPDEIKGTGRTLACIQGKDISTGFGLSRIFQLWDKQFFMGNDQLNP